MSIPGVIRSLREQIVSELERAIITGEFRPGQRLIERKLTARFGVSSIPIREALQELELRGLVSRRPNCGCSVIELSTQEAGDICRLRRVLEPKVMEWAAERMSPESAGQLTRQFQRLSDTGAANDVASFFHEDLQFHKLIWSVSGNTFAIRALEAAVGSLFVAGLINASSAGTLNLGREVAKHRRLLKALRARDGKAAARILLEIAQTFEQHVEPRRAVAARTT